MKRNFLTYTFFIMAFLCFILLRVYAGKNFDGTVADTTIDPNEKVLDISEDNSQNTSVVFDKSTQKDKNKSELIFDEWHGDFTPEKAFGDELPRIVCWGDSLTESYDEKSAYPDILRELSGCEVLNYGVNSENTRMIAMRAGAIRVNVKSTVIPADRQMIPVFLKTENDGNVSFLQYGDGGVNPCSICGIEGRLEKLNGAYYFTRSTKGERIAVPDGTQFKTFGMTDSNPNDVLVIFTGTNDKPSASSIKEIIRLQRAMLEAAECDKYVVIGLTFAGGIPEIDAINETLAKEYGKHFLDIRSYFLNFGVEDAGLNMTEGDIADISMGEIPRSLRSDYVHGNRHYYRLLAEQVYRKMQYLGYLPSN